MPCKGKVTRCIVLLTGALINTRGFTCILYFVNQYKIPIFSIFFFDFSSDIKKSPVNASLFRYGIHLYWTLCFSSAFREQMINDTKLKGYRHIYYRDVRIVNADWWKLLTVTKHCVTSLDLLFLKKFVILVKKEV